MSEAPKLRVLRREATVTGPGAGRRLVLVHGSLDRATSFTRLMKRLRDWTIVAYDRRG
jgi:pimeloyl-ACP methyl ester carboxylesterase